MSNGSQRRWLSVRRYLNSSRATLTAVAADLAAEWPRVEPALITAEGWLPGAPVPLERVRLAWRTDPPPTRVTGTEPQAFLVLPLREDGQRYASYAEVLGDVDPPATFEDRPCYRLLAAAPDGDEIRLEFGPGSYFEGVNVAEAVAHELAAVYMASADRGGRPHLNRTDLPLRALVGEPADLAARTVVPALCTLTVRHDTDSGEASFVLHWRDPQRVASAGGMYQVAPVGVFQPARSTPAAPDAAAPDAAAPDAAGPDAAAPDAAGPDAAGPDADPDFDRWRGIARELEEELLGVAELRDVDYPSWPFLRGLDDARGTGRCRAYYLGLGVDPLTFVADLMTVVVLEAATFDKLFAGLVADNAEGRLIHPVPFTEENITRYARTEPTQPAGAALLELAWRHRGTLLS
ncbi:MAG: XRE family transcriptional regulator [Micromonosporaceae bacterium]